MKTWPRIKVGIHNVTHTCKGVESCFEFKTAAREFQEYTIKEYGTSVKEPLQIDSED